MTTSGFRDEFRCSSLWLNHDQPHHFARSQWSFPHAVYIGWRFFWTLFHTGWFVRSVQLHIHTSDSESDDPKWLIYLTNWSYALIVLQSWLHSAIVVYHKWMGHTQSHHYGSESRWFHKLHWLITVVTFDASIVVTVLFWALVFEKLTYALTVMTHGVNSLYTISDTVMSHTPSRLMHVVFAIAYALVYVLFSLVYYLADGTDTDGNPYIYKSLDWSNTGPTVGLTVAVCLVAVPLIHIFMFGLTKLRVYLADQCHSGSDDSGGVEMKEIKERQNV